MPKSPLGNSIKIRTENMLLQTHIPTKNDLTLQKNAQQNIHITSVFHYA